MPRNAITESVALLDAQPKVERSGRLQIGLITPGWGSSGYYSSKVLENAATNRVFPAGTQMFLDHPGQLEEHDRPERSVRDLAAVLTEDATWDGTRLVAEAQAFGPYVPLLTDDTFTGAIGVSIRAYADSTVGEAEGRQGRIITDLAEAISVDFVTKAGRGGSILQVLESARPERVVERAIAHGVAEATANDTREALQQALRDAYGGEQSWVWVRDFDDATVWYDHDLPDESGTYAEGYSIDDAGAVTLAGGRTGVRARTEYVPITTTTVEVAVHLDADEYAARMAEARQILTEAGASAADAEAAAAGALRLAGITTDVPVPAGQLPNPNPTEETMGSIQVDEAEHGRLTEAAGRVPTLEAERNAAVERADTSEQQLAEAHRTIDRGRAADLARTAAAEAGVTLNPLEVAGLTADYPCGDNGRIDETAFTTQAQEAIAQRAAAAGAGRVFGFGDTTSDNKDATAEAHRAVDAAFGRTTKEA